MVLVNADYFDGFLVANGNLFVTKKGMGYQFGWILVVVHKTNELRWTIKTAHRTTKALTDAGVGRNALTGQCGAVVEDQKSISIHTERIRRRRVPEFREVTAFVLQRVVKTIRLVELVSAC